MAALEGADDKAKLISLNSRTHKEQAVWFLNAFWDQQQKEAEKVWEFHNSIVELCPNGAEGCDLDEITAHRFLEKREETLTVREMRNVLRKIDIDNSMTVSLTEYLIFRYEADWHKLVNSKQCDTSDEIQKAQAMLEDAQQKLSAARNSADRAKKAENEQKAAEKELRNALEELHKQEEAFLSRKAELERLSQVGSVMKRSKAKQELDIHMASDPLPLRRAKINQGAAVRKAERATAKAVKLREEAEEMLKQAEESFRLAEEFLVECQSRAGSGQGALWFVARELEEAKKYLPQSKGGKPKK